MWLENELHPDVPSSQMIATFRIAAELDEARLAEAWARVVASSDALRSVFARVDGEPRRAVRDDLEGTLERFDLSSAVDVEGALAAWVIDRKQRPFALDVCAFDAAILRVGPSQFVWYLGLHHLITDAASFALVYRRVLDVYLGEPLAEAPPYEAWVTERAAREGTAEHVRDDAFWRARLQDPPPPLRPYGRPRACSPYFVRHALSLAPHVGALRSALSNVTGAPPTDASMALASMTLAAAWVARVSGNRRLGLGTPLANRPHKPARETIGAFLEVAPLRVTLDDDETFASLFAKLRGELIAILPHSRHTVSNPSSAPAFEAMVNHHTASFPARLGPTRTELTTGVVDVPLERRRTPSLSRGPEAEQVVITLHDFDGTGAPTLLVDFREDLLDATARVDAVGHLVRLLDAFAQDPDRPIDAVPLVSADECARLLALSRRSSPVKDRASGDAARDVAVHREAHGDAVDGEALHGDAVRGETALDLVFARAARNPDAVAVVHRERETRYRELVDATLHLAARLEAAGVAPGDRVVVCVERSTQMLVALLATWRVGAAYVPIDPAHPALRSAVVLEDAHARAAITQRALGLLEGFEGPTLFVEEEPSVDALDAPSAHARPPRADDVAYVLFTSGSTGRPKGVAIGHRAFATFLRAMAHEPGLGADDRLLAITTLGFDIAGLELFLPLVVGATVEIADRELALDPNALRDRLLRAPTITTLQATPTTWRMLIEAGLPPSSLRALVGGEALPRPLASALLPRVRDLWNLYGPTETTVWSTAHRVRERDLDAEIPIGRPIAGTRTYVLDPRRRLVPAGVVGELWIGGLGVADGYLGRPELTAERFFEDPFVEDGAVASDVTHDEPRDADVTQGTQRRARMYRTGDLASLDPEGVLHYHGRLDRQIKLRGHRIEPGEVEHVLAQHPRVRAAVVRLRELPSGPRLEAFVEGDVDLAPSELAEFARARLPEYMVPASVGVLDVFPLTPSGKVDLAGLPIGEDTSSERAWAPPIDDLELLLGALFSELLGVTQVGRDDDFFALGGHSLLALQLARRVREEVGAELGVGRVLEARTVAALAEVLRHGHSAPPSLVPLFSPVARGRNEGRVDVAPLFFVCGIHLYHEVARHLADVPSFGLFAAIEEEVVAALQSGRPPPKLTVRSMADRYVELLVRGRRGHEPLRLAGSSFGGVLAFEMARLLRARGEEVELVVLLDSILPSARRRSWSAWARARWQELDLASAGSMARRAARSVSERPLGRTVRHAGRRLGLARSEDVRAPHDPAGESHDVEVLRERLYLEAMSTWERESDARYDGDVLVVRASDRHEHVSDRVAHDLGWGARVRGSMEVVEVPGDHLGIVHGTSAARVAEEIRRRLAPARS